MARRGRALRRRYGRANTRPMLASTLRIARSQGADMAIHGTSASKPWRVLRGSTSHPQEADIILGSDGQYYMGAWRQSNMRNPAGYMLSDVIRSEGG
jgi:hypothetical protein